MIRLSKMYDNTPGEVAGDGAGVTQFSAGGREV